MGKFKAVISLILMSLLISAMCFFCTVSFPVNDIDTFFSTTALTGKDITLGDRLDEENYLGGGYSAIYYPEGVIPAKEYEDDLAAYLAAENTEKVEEHQKKYPEALKSGGLYLESEVASEDDGKTVSDAFKEKIEKTFCVIKDRYEALHIDGLKMEVISSYALRITLPQIYTARNYALRMMAYTGELTVSIGSSEDSATQVFPEKGGVIGDYLKGFRTRTAADGTAAVGITFTSLGRKVIKEKTADGSSTTVFFKVGDDTAVQFNISSTVDQKTMYISGGFTKETAAATAVLMNSALENGLEGDLSVSYKASYGDTLRVPATFGDNALLFVYIAFGVTVLAMAIFFFVRYGRLGFAHLLTYLMFLFAMLLCIWAIPFLYISVGSVLGLLCASIVLSIGNVLPYEYARKEYASGRTMAASVKSAYKKTLWHVIDMHVVLAALAFIIYGISLTGLAAFAFTFGLGVGFSLLCSLLIGRLSWASMMSFTSKKGNFCRFKREEVEEDD